MKKLLIVSHCVPYPPDKGERLRVFHIINVLGRFFNLYLLCFSRGAEKYDIRYLQSYCKEIKVFKVDWLRGFLKGGVQLLKGDSLTRGFYDIRKAHQTIRKWGRFDVAIGYSAQMFHYIQRAYAEVRIMDLVDVDSLKWEQYSTLATKPLSLCYRKEAHAVRNLERWAISSCNATVFISSKEAIKAPVSNEKIIVIPNGVDNKYFHPGTIGSKTRFSIVFIGSMNYRPNIQAVLWFVQNVWQNIKKRFPSAQFWIVGRNPTQRIRKLNSMWGIKVTGSVMDVRPYLNKASVAIAPLLIGRGIQNKVLECAVMGIPTIASPQALDGLNLVPGVEIIQAQTPAQWRSSISGMFSDSKYRNQIASAGRRAVLERYKWATFEARFSGLVNKLISNSTFSNDLGDMYEREKRIGSKKR